MVPEAAPSAAPLRTTAMVNFLATCHVMGAHMARHKWVRARLGPPLRTHRSVSSLHGPGPARQPVPTTTRTGALSTEG